MMHKDFFRTGCAALLSALVIVPAFAEEAAAPAEEPKANPEMEEAVKYIEALVDNAYPDFAEPIIAATKKKWPETDARLFAIEVRATLSMGKFEEAEKKIASLPDRKSTKYWAARLEVAKNYFARQRKAEGMKIYDEFFKLFPTAPKDLRDFYMQACYEYGQLLFLDKQYEKAAARYSQLLTQVKGDGWLNLASETAKMYLKLADDTPNDAANKKRRDDFLAKAGKIVDQMLWHLESPVYFGMGVSMKAHIEELKGDPKRAEELIEEYMGDLRSIHEQLVEADPEGTQGLLKLSALPECLYLQAKMLWAAAQAEFKKPKHDDELVKGFMFGKRPAPGQKRDGHGAFNLAVNVFIKYESSPWAAPAGELSEEVRAFAEKQYKAKIRTQVTKEQIARVRAAQFKQADEKFLADQYEDAIAAYFEVLAKYPELQESATAVGRIVSCYLDLLADCQDKAKRDEYRLNADAVESYLAERFAGHKDRLVMISGGNAAIGAAAKEQERKNLVEADRVYTAFLANYTAHPNAAPLAQARALEFEKDGRWKDALRYWEILENNYTGTVQYVAAIARIANCWNQLGDSEKQAAYLNKYLPVETVKVRRLQAKMQLAQLYQRMGLAILNGADTNETAEAVAAAETEGTKKIIYAIKEFSGFAQEADRELADPGVTANDKASYTKLREAAVFLVGDCYGRINRPEAAKAKMRERAAASYETYIRDYPEGQYVKTAYVKLGTIYTAMGDLAKSKDALDRLSKAYPDSDEAKNAMPRLAKNLVEMGMKREGCDIYAQMLRTDGKYTAVQFLNAGEALIEAKSWDLANQAFDKAGNMAGTNQQTVVARSRIGKAKTAFRQGSLAEAREALDLFLGDAKMSKMIIAADANQLLAEVASEQGRTEKDAQLRTKYFNAAVGAIKKLRNYWKAKPQWEQDAIDLQSGGILIRKMEAEEAMGLKDEAMETCGRAAATFQVFIQSHGPTEAVPFEKFDDGSKANLEQAYAKLLPLFVKQGSKQAEQVIKFGEKYLELFPDGRSKTVIVNSMNQAKADLPSGAAAAPAGDAEASK